MVRRGNGGKQARRWLFTINNPNRTGILRDEMGNTYPDETEAGVSTALAQGKGFRYLVFQLEQGEAGTDHYQGTTSLL